MSRSQCFERVEFAPLVRELQKAAAGGRGAVVTTTLRTVANEWWGLAGGTEVRIVWSYISQCSEWEHELPVTVQSTLLGGMKKSSRPLDQPTILGDASRAAPSRYIASSVRDFFRRLRTRGLDSFPQYPLNRLRLSAVESNALYQQSGWAVLSNRAQLDALFMSGNP